MLSYLHFGGGKIRHIKLKYFPHIPMVIKQGRQGLTLGMSASEIPTIHCLVYPKKLLLKPTCLEPSTLSLGCLLIHGQRILGTSSGVRGKAYVDTRSTDWKALWCLVLVLMKSSGSPSHVNYPGGLLGIRWDPWSVLSSLLHKRTLRLQLTESRPAGHYHLDSVTVSSGAFPESAFLTQPSTPLDHTLNIHTIIGQALCRYQQWLPEVKCL